MKVLTGTEYDSIFSRNAGVFSVEQQQILKNLTVLIIGTGGIGSIAAEAFARSGAGNFILSDFDEFDFSNINRQAGSFISTVGMKKVESAAKRINDINPEAVITTYKRKLSEDELRELVQKVDFVFPAADDFSFSIGVFDICREYGKPALMVVPAGMWAVTAVIPPAGVSVRDLHGLPAKSDYASLKRLFDEDLYPASGFFYKKICKFNREWFEDFREGRRPPAQICPVVWSASCIGVMESIKYLTGAGRSVLLPAYYEITSRGIKKRNLLFPSFRSLMVAGRRIFSEIKFRKRRKS